MSSVTLAIFRVILFPDAKTISDSLLEVSSVVAAVSPGVLSMSFRQTIHILALVAVAIGKLFHTLTVF